MPSQTSTRSNTALAATALLSISAVSCHTAPSTNDGPMPPSGTKVDEPIRGTLTPVLGFAARHIGSWAPWTTEFSSTLPASIATVPQHSPGAVFGEFSFGDGTRYQQPATPVGFMLDEPRERFIIDTNRNGDLTDDLLASWMVERRAVRDGEKTAGTVTVRSEVATSSSPDANSWSVALFFTEQRTREEFGVEFSIDRYRDYATEGVIELGGKTYRILLDDGAVTGDFTHSLDAPRMELELLIDVNANGIYEQRGETFSVNEPFTLNGVTYEVSAISRDGTRIELIRSTRSVAEIPPPPVLRPGAVVPSFTVNTIDGAPLSFPKDFAGQIVLLDFWASWCGPCIGELPNLQATYQEFKDRGFTIVSISIDRDEKRDAARTIIEERGLNWIQCFDSGGWEGEIITRFSPGGIPAGYLVDGSTGRIIATEGRLRANALRSTVRAALEMRDATDKFENEKP